MNFSTLARRSLFFPVVFAAPLLFGQADIANGPAFSSSPAALQDAFSRLKPGTNPVSVLLEEAVYEFDAQGHLTERHHLIYKAQTKDGAEGWDQMEESWAPWEEDRPQLRARVIAADGTVRELNPATIAESAAKEDDEDLVTDRRRLRAPLPAMAVGSIVEQETLVRQTRAAIEDAGDVHTFYFGDSVPVEQTRVIIRAPQSLPLRFKTVLLPDLRVKDETRAGVREIVMEQGSLDPSKDPLPLLPSDEPRGPKVVFSTASSWNALATAYSGIVEKQLQGFDARSFLPKFAANATREEKMLAIVEKINSEIRYTGLEFAESTVVPHLPSEVLDHKYGDCKDKATLAVAVLRAAGLPSYVALLRSTTGSDVMPDLPGISGFNHAIVYVPGTPDYWLDLTDPDLRLGVVSTPNQGRLSLIARPQTTALLRTPELGVEQNRIVETREFRLSELGRADVVESTEVYGVADRQYRGIFTSNDQDELKKTLKEYVDTVYGEAKFANVEHGNSDDLSMPFRLKIELNDVQRGITGRTEAVVAIFPTYLAGRLPSFFRTQPEEDKTKTARTADFVISEPYTYEYHYKIVAPPGFRIRQLPESVDQPVGVASFSMKFTRQSETDVSADLRFVMPQRRMSAAQGLALRTAVVEFQKTKPVLVYFDQTGETALAQGNVSQALASFGELRKLHPDEALHSLQYARALLTAGAGESARTEAKRAVNLDPKSFTGQLQLAEILKHDLVGREMVPGFDRDGAIEAYRKALEIDSEDAETRANLAILLEYDRNGMRYGKSARIDEAIIEYQKILKNLADLGIPNNYAIALLRAGSIQALKDYLRNQPDNEINLTLSVCADAMLNGVPAAVNRAGTISGVAARQRVLASAAQTLVQVRRFDLAAGLMEAATAGAQSPANVASAIQIFRRTKPAEQLPKTAVTPEDAVRLLFMRLVLYEDHKDDWADSLDSLIKDEATAHPDSLRRTAASMANEFSGLTLEVAADLILAAMDLSHEGDDDKGYVVRLPVPGGGSDLSFFVAREGATYKIVEMGDDDGPFGRYILQLVKQGRVEQAAIWLDRARRGRPGGDADDPLSSRFSRLWSTNQTERTTDAVRLAAGALIAGKKYPEVNELVPLFETARQQANAAKAAAISGVLADFYFSLDRNADAKRIAADLLQQFPQSSTALGMAVHAAYAADGRAGGRATIDANQTRFAQDTSALRALALYAMVFDDVERSSDINRAIIASGRANTGDYNQLAWGDLMIDKVTATTLETVNKGMVLAGSRPVSGLMHTAAAVNAVLGKPSDARTTILERLKLNGSPEPTDDDWYVFGLIAEQYGLRDEAVAMYRKVMRPENEVGLSGTSYALAQRRLEALATKRP